MSAPQMSKTAPDSGKMLKNAQLTTDFLKSIAHAGRLMILCRLAEGPASVAELEETLTVPQTSVSKQLARLRQENLVSFERQGRSIIYTLSDERARQLVGTLYEIFCEDQDSCISEL